MNQLIPVSKPYISSSDKESMQRAIDSGWISSLGDFVVQAESKVGVLTSKPYNLMVSNGTVALEIALRALSLPYGSKVIVPNFTFAAVVNAVINVGLVPMLCDVDRYSWNVSVDLLSRLNLSDVSAAIIVHSYGVPADIKNICGFFKDRGIYTIEDCAEAHFAKHKGELVGSFADISTFSFYGNKIITSGEGGAVSTSDFELLERLKMLRDHGMNPIRKFDHLIVGGNNRITNPQCALLVSQFNRVNEIIEKRNHIFQRYQDNLGSDFCCSTADNEDIRVNWLFTIELPDNIQRDDLILYLRKWGVETRPVFRPISSFSFIKSSECFPNTEQIASKGISLPTFEELEDHQIDYVCEKVLEFCEF